MVVFAAGPGLGAVKAQDVSQPSNTASKGAVHDAADQLQRRLANERSNPRTSAKQKRLAKKEICKAQALEED